MRLRIPMEAVAVGGQLAHCAAKGVEREVSLFLPRDQIVAIGDFDLVLVGYAMLKSEPQEPRSACGPCNTMVAAKGAHDA